MYEDPKHLKEEQHELADIAAKAASAVKSLFVIALDEEERQVDVFYTDLQYYLTIPLADFQALSEEELAEEIDAYIVSQVRRELQREARAKARKRARAKKRAKPVTPS
jgi:hypothetical protein